MFLFDRQNPEPAVLPRDSHIADPPECKRLSGQSQRILARLQQGPASNAELAAISLKYTSRISDLRKAGYHVEVIERSRVTGWTLYQLFSAEGASR